MMTCRVTSKHAIEDWSGLGIFWYGFLFSLSFRFIINFSLINSDMYTTLLSSATWFVLFLFSFFCFSFTSILPVRAGIHQQNLSHFSFNSTNTVFPRSRPRQDEKSKSLQANCNCNRPLTINFVQPRIPQIILTGLSFSF